MKHLVWVLVLGSALWSNPRYFLYQEVTIPKESSSEEKRKMHIQASPIFFKPQTHSYKEGVLIYDLFQTSSHYAKQVEDLKIVGGFSLNKVYASRLSEGVDMRWILGGGTYLNIARSKGVGGLGAYSHTTLSAEARARIAGQFLFDEDYMLELSLQLPILGVRLFGYDPTRGQNVLFVVRFLYGD